MTPPTRRRTRHIRFKISITNPMVAKTETKRKKKKSTAYQVMFENSSRCSIDLRKIRNRHAFFKPGGRKKRKNKTTFSSSRSPNLIGNKMAQRQTKLVFVDIRAGTPTQTRPTWGELFSFHVFSGTLISSLGFTGTE